MSSVLLWFRSELRLHDNAALKAALDLDLPIIPVVIQDSNSGDPWQPGGASKWWFHQAIKDLSDQLEARGSKLIIRTGNEQPVLESLINETGASHLVWSRSWEPFRRKQDKSLASHFKGEGVNVSWHVRRAPLISFPQNTENTLEGRIQKLPLEAGRQAPQGLARGQDGLPHRGRWHARALANRLDAQPRTHDRGVCFGKTLFANLASRR